MGKNFEINKSGMPEEEIIEKFGKAPEAITEAQNPENFSYKEPNFEVRDGRLFGGDLSAFERFKQLTTQRQTSEELNVESVVVNCAIEPCC